jgi:plastocyanin
MYKKLLPVIFFILPVFILSITVLAGDIKGKVNLGEEQNSNGVLIYIEHVDSTFTPLKKTVVMDQKNFMFVPKVLPVLAGTTVNFLNSDSVLHNVFTPTKCAGSFNLGTWPRGQFRSYTFNNAGCFVTILCDVHPYMQAWIPVLQNPFFAQTNQDGEYEINNIPPGNYRLIIWYPFYKTKSIQVVLGTQTLVKNFTLERITE